MTASQGTSRAVARRWAAEAGASVAEGLRLTAIGLDRTTRTRRAETLVFVNAIMLAAIALGSSAALAPAQIESLPLLVTALIIPAAFAVHRPLLAWRMCWLIGLLAPLVPHESRLDLVQIGIETVFFCVAAIRFGRPAIVGMWLLELASIWVWTDEDWRVRLVVSGVLSLVAIAVDALTGRRAIGRELATQTQLTRAEAERRAVLEERARIAREMHDVVAHHLSLIAVQTTTAPYRLTEVPADVRAELDSINTAARAALADTRALLDTLREPADGAELAPQPTLGQITDLIDATRRAGVEVTYRHEPSDVPSLVAVSAYRIVQEALSNAARHAPGACIDVMVAEVVPDRLLVRVRNSAAAAPDRTVGHKPGHGLSGMRERVGALEGSLTTGATADGGFEVCAELPIGRTS